MKNKILFAFLISLGGFLGCKKDDKNGFLSTNLGYSVRIQSAVIAGTLYRSGAMATDQSTRPIEFSIAGVYDAKGNDASSYFFKEVETASWKLEFTGNEKTADDVIAKKEKKLRPTLDVNPLNGEVFIYPEADTTKIPKGKYTLDIKVRNPAGETVVKDALTLNVSYNPGYSYVFSGVDGAVSRIEVTFKKVGEGKKIRVYTVDEKDKAVDPKNLLGYDYSSAQDGSNLKNWKSAKFASNYTEFPDRVEFDAAFPFPTSGVTTIDIYNNSSVNGKYLNYWFNFAIFKQGDWDVKIKIYN